MKKKILAFVLVLALLCSVTYIVALAAAGDASDPIITLSYVEDVLIPRLKADIKASVVQELQGQTSTTQPPSNPQGSTGEPQGFEVVTLYEGDTLTASGGALEFVLRTGRALSVTVTQGEGISNLTSGADQQGGELISHNSLYLIPRADGRGLTAQGECWVMVRGGYKIT